MNVEWETARQEANDQPDNCIRDGKTDTDLDRMRSVALEGRPKQSPMQ